MLEWNRKVSWKTMPMWLPIDSRVRSRTSWPSIRTVGEGDALKSNRSSARREWTRARSVGDRDGHVHNIEQPLKERQRARHAYLKFGQVSGGARQPPGEHDDEGHDCPDASLASEHKLAEIEPQHRRAGHPKRLHEQLKPAADHLFAHLKAPELVVHAAEACPLVALPDKRLDKQDPGDPENLLEVDGYAAELLLGSLARGEGRSFGAAGRHYDQWPGYQRVEYGQAPVEHGHESQRGRHYQQVVNHPEDRAADDVLDPVHVVADPAHHLAGAALGEKP